MAENEAFNPLENLLLNVPSIEGPIGTDYLNGLWSVTFSIKIDHPLAWNVIQEFANILNYLSIKERLPTVFKPMSAPSYLNGGPDEALFWTIYATAGGFTPKDCADWLMARLPRPSHRVESWRNK